MNNGSFFKPEALMRRKSTYSYTLTCGSCYTEARVQFDDHRNCFEVQMECNCEDGPAWGRGEGEMPASLYDCVPCHILERSLTEQELTEWAGDMADQLVWEDYWTANVPWSIADSPPKPEAYVRNITSDNDDMEEPISFIVRGVSPHHSFVSVTWKDAVYDNMPEAYA